MINKFPVGSVWRTRDGHKATVLANDLDKRCPILTRCYRSGSETEDVLHLLPNGRMYETAESVLDLIYPWREPMKVSGWIVVNCYGEPRDTFYTLGKVAEDRVNDLDLEYPKEIPHTAIYVEGKEDID